MTDIEKQQFEHIIKSQGLEIEQLENVVESQKATIGGLQDKMKELITELAKVKENKNDYR